MHKIHQCKYCSYKSVKSTDVIRHEFRHTGEYPLTCLTCDKKFAKKFDLLRHKRSDIDGSYRRK